MGVRSRFYGSGVFPSLMLSLLTASPLARGAEGYNCPKPPGGACGQCEPELQAKMDDLLQKASTGKIKTADDFLGSVPIEIRRNAVIVADSKSPEPATIDLTPPPPPKIWPRIVMKSPNSEVWLAFNTDPHAKGYDKVQIIRWDGKEPGFKMQQVQFDQASGTSPSPKVALKNPHVSLDASKDCVKCHREQERPNFDSYQTWAGFIPPRDDVLEKGRDGKPDPNTQAWFNVMKRAIRAKKEGAAGGNRLRFLEVPLDGPQSDDEKLRLIQQQVDEGPAVTTANNTNADTSTLYGYRIPHFPNKASGLLKNTSVKTFANAGFGHTAFDQLLNLQMCQVATKLERRPDYGRFKYALSALVNGCTSGSGILEYLPASAQTKADRFFADEKIASSTQASDPSQVISSVLGNTSSNEKSLDTQKQARHSDFLSRLGVGASSVEYGKKLVSVGDTSASDIAAIRYLLEPLGVKVGDWSLSFGSDLSKPSYTFADQFGLLYEQETFAKVKREYESSGSTADYCSWLQGKSLKSFSSDQVAAVKEGAHPRDASEILADCSKKSRADASSVRASAEISAAADVSLRVLRDRAKETLSDCMACHSDKSVVDVNLPAGQTNVFDEANLKSWLASRRAGSGSTWFERIVDAVRYQTQKKMPPSDPLDDDDRNGLLGYLASVELSSDGSGKGYACEMANQGISKKSSDGGIELGNPPASGDAGAAAK